MPERGRRALLRRGAALAAGVATGRATAADGTPPNDRPPWMRVPGQPFSNYGQPSPFEKQVIRRIGANRMAPGNGVSWTPLEDLEGFLTPSGLHFERHHVGVPAIDPAKPSR